jgi:hypothetical protein
VCRKFVVVFVNETITSNLLEDVGPFAEACRDRYPYTPIPSFRTGTIPSSKRYGRSIVVAAMFAVDAG